MSGWIQSYFVKRDFNGILPMSLLFLVVLNYVPNLLTPFRRVLLEKLLFAHPMKKFRPFVEHKDLLSYLQEIATDPYLEQHES
jgi:hypothetical protein